MNKSQKPACVSARGSKVVPTAAAQRRTISHGQRMPMLCSSVTLASIQIVRCDGTRQPEKSSR